MQAALLVPDDAPFSPEQRAWLNGFFAGLLGNAGAPAAPAEPEEETPWHDPGILLPERLEMAQDRSAPMKLMAAMGQLDCGQCGYNCKDYAAAIAAGAEGELNLCQPGGVATQRAIKKLLAEAPPAPPVSAAKSGKPAVAEGLIVHAKALNAAGSDKDTRAVVFDIAASGLSYAAGDSLGVYPENCTELVDAVLSVLGGAPESTVTLSGDRQMSLREALTTACDLSRPSDGLLALLARSATAPDEAAQLRAYADGTADLPDGDVLDVLAMFPSARPDPLEVPAALGRLQHRLYSISSSPLAHPGEVHLTVGTVRYERAGRKMKGVASTFLADRVEPGTKVRLMVQPSHGFRLPEQHDTPIIMIGPGTGIAPFRGFLHERRAAGATGRNWLFFGDQRRATDYLYETELEQFVKDGHLHKLDLAFSRDQTEKIYVQHMMEERGAELWAWLQEGAYIYVCGDAKRMARDVDEALHAVARTHGGLDEAGAKAFVAQLTKDKRYRRDVY